MLGMVLYPAKRGTADGPRLLYFGDVLEFDTTDELAQALRELDGDTDGRIVRNSSRC